MNALCGSVRPDMLSRVTRTDASSLHGGRRPLMRHVYRNPPDDQSRLDRRSISSGFGPGSEAEVHARAQRRNVRERRLSALVNSLPDHAAVSTLSVQRQVPTTGAVRDRRPRTAPPKPRFSSRTGSLARSMTQPRRRPSAQRSVALHSHPMMISHWQSCDSRMRTTPSPLAVRGCPPGQAWRVIARNSAPGRGRVSARSGPSGRRHGSWRSVSPPRVHPCLSSTATTGSGRLTVRRDADGGPMQPELDMVPTQLIHNPGHVAPLPHSGS